MKTQSSFIRTDSAVHLHSITAIDTEISFIIDPRHAEHDNSFRFHQSFHDGGFFVLRVFFNERNDRLSYFENGLEKLRLRWVSSFYQLHEFINCRTFSCNHKWQVSLDDGGYFRQKVKKN